MSHIPGFPLGNLGPNNPQQTQPNIPPNFNLFNQQQQQALLAQHQQLQQRQLQSSPQQPQVVPGVTDQEHQRMWQAMDQHVRPHNDTAQTNPAFNQMTDYLRASGVSHQQHDQQARIGMQGFPQQIQHPQPQNPTMNPSANPNPMHHSLNSNSMANPFSGGGLAQLTVAQLQALAERNPAVRLTLQQHQHRQQAQAQQQAAQQQQHAGTAGAPFDNLSPNMTGPNLPQAQHPLTPANVSANANANSAELSRQFQLLTRAGQNQGQSGNTLTQGSPGMHPARPQQPSQIPQRPHNSPFQQQQLQNGSQMSGGNVPLGTHVGPQPHPSAGQQPHPNRQMFPVLASQLPPNTNPNLSGPLMFPGNHQQLPQQANQQQQQQLLVNLRRWDKQKIDQQIASLHGQLTSGDVQLRSLGFNSSMMANQMTEEQRVLLTELQNKKAMFMKLTQIRQQIDRIQPQVPPGGVPSTSNEGGMIQNGHGMPGNPSQAIAQAQMVQNWLQHSMHNGSKSGPPPPQLAARPPSQAQPQTQTHPPPSPFQQQQQQQQLAQYQIQQAQALQRSGSAQPQLTSAQMMHRQQQQQQGAPQQTNQPPQQQPPHTMRPGQVFPLDQGQASTPQRPPSAPQQQQQPQPQLRTQVVDGVQVPDRTNFDAQLKQWLVKRRENLEPRMLMIDTKEINLYDLHVEVLKKGGGNAVTQNNLWPVIGANIGFEQFPANGTEPAKASPAVASHLMNVHKVFLSSWENAYIARLLQQRRRQAVANAAHGLPPPIMGISHQQLQQQQAQQQQLQQAQQQAIQRPQPPNGYPFLQSQMVSQSQGQPLEPQRQAQQGQQPPQHLGFRQGLHPSAYIQFAHTSVEEMRKQGIPEHNINLIETHRPQLQKQWQQQQQQLRAAGGAQTPGSSMASRPQPAVPAGSPTGPQQLVSQPQHPVAQGQNNFQIPVDVARPPQMTPHSVPASVNNVSQLQQAPNSVPRPPGQLTRPTLQQINAAMTFIHLAETEYSNKRRTFPSVQVSEHEKGSYMQQFDQLWRLVQEVEKKLVMYHALFGDEQSTHKLVAIIVTTKEQRKMLATPAAPPQYILGSQIVRSLLVELSSMMDRFYKAIASMAPTPSAPPQGTIPPASGPAALDPLPRPNPSLQPPAQQSPQPRSTAPPASQPVPKTAKKPPAPAPAPVSTPSPAAHTPSVQTPAAATQTPPTASASSPHTPKSPPKKPAAKVKPSQKRRPSKSSQQPLPETGPIKQPTPKRPREEEPQAQGALSQPSTGVGEPSPKRIKRAEWDGPPSEELEKRRQEVEEVHTEQDVQAFITRATEDFLTSGNEDGVEASQDGFPQTLHDLFKGAPIFDLPDIFPIPSSSDPAPVAPTSSPKLSDNALESSILDFFDFSQCAPDEPVASSSKLDTPELVHGSSANPSPESVAETPKGEHAAVGSGKAKDAIKIEENTTSATLAPGVWEEINGGEPAYYEPPGWKWEGEMTVMESPWAISSAGT